MSGGASVMSSSTRPRPGETVARGFRLSHQASLGNGVVPDAALANFLREELRVGRERALPLEREQFRFLSEDAIAEREAVLVAHRSA